MFEKDVLESSWGLTMGQDRLTHLRILSRLTSPGTGSLPNSIMAVLLPVQAKRMIRVDRASLFTPPIVVHAATFSTAILLAVSVSALF